MAHGEPGPPPASRNGAGPSTGRAVAEPPGAGCGPVVETTVSPFHCLYQDALWLHTQSHLRLPDPRARPAGWSGRAAPLSPGGRALVHQAAVELGRPELSHLLSDPTAPSAGEAWACSPRSPPRSPRRPSTPNARPGPSSPS